MLLPPHTPQILKVSDIGELIHALALIPNAKFIPGMKNKHAHSPVAILRNKIILVSLSLGLLPKVGDTKKRDDCKMGNGGGEQQLG